jgi:hypothetical protein
MCVNHRRSGAGTPEDAGAPAANGASGKFYMTEAVSGDQKRIADFGPLATPSSASSKTPTTRLKNKQAVISQARYQHAK